MIFNLFIFMKTKVIIIMKKRNLNGKLALRKNSVSNLQIEKVKGGGNTDICTGTQPSCAGCDTPTRNPCVRPTRGDWTCQGCPQQ
ncbi:hypothetical protein KAOT1_07118 [Kordia algicida OT-1]|uniref:Uncharacterized protein n=2 Tax=Kordia TaxID=221065 RepID=A9DWM9_9FLAO|nr:hypothetical protein KAOT1_07118 [Kordia algicida OT-1]